MGVCYQGPRRREKLVSAVSFSWRLLASSRNSSLNPQNSIPCAGRNDPPRTSSHQHNKSKAPRKDRTQGSDTLGAVTSPTGAAEGPSKRSSGKSIWSAAGVSMRNISPKVHAATISLLSRNSVRYKTSCKAAWAHKSAGKAWFASSC